MAEPGLQRIVTTTDQLQVLVNALKESKTIVWDTETTGLDKIRNFPVGHAFSVGPGIDNSFYVPIRHGGGGNLPGCRIPENPTDFKITKDLHPFEVELAKIAKDQSKHWIGHNIKYDMWMASRIGVTIEGTVEDTKVNSALIDENQGRHDLDYVAKAMGIKGKVGSILDVIEDMLKERGIKGYDKKDLMGYLWMLPGDGMAGVYGANDGEITWGVREEQLKRIEEDELERVYSIEKETTKVLFEMEYAGVPVDVAVLDRVSEKVAFMLKGALKKLPDGLNVKSGPQVHDYVKSLGRRDWPTTPKGAPSFPESYLETFKEGQEIILVRKLRNLDSTFLTNSIRNNLVNGHVHCNFNQTKTEDYGVVTGRLSSSGPNMQQIPKRDKVLAPLLRQIYRHPTDDWLSPDYSQQEYRVFAEFSGSKLVLDAYDRDPKTDYHQLVADLLSVERDPAAKRINLGTIYNMGEPTLAANLGVTLRVAQGYMNRMRAMMPEARGFNKGCERIAKSRGYVRTIMGRRRRFPSGRGAHKAGNSVIQGSCADLTKLKMVEVRNYLKSEGCRTKMVLQVHDELNFISPPSEKKVQKEIVKIMEDFGPESRCPLRVPMAVDVGLGRSWGHASFPKHTDWI